MNSPIPRHENRAMHDKLNELLSIARQNATDIAALRADLTVAPMQPAQPVQTPTSANLIGARRHIMLDPNAAQNHVTAIQRLATQIAMAANDPNAIKTLTDQLQAEAKALGDGLGANPPPVQTVGTAGAPVVPGAVNPIDKKD